MYLSLTVVPVAIVLPVGCSASWHMSMYLNWQQTLQIFSDAEELLLVKEIESQSNFFDREALLHPNSVSTPALTCR